jgi:hypothetical protein
MQKTHPVYASLDHPLFACGVKRVGEWIREKKKLLYPLSSEAEERVDKRSDAGGESINGLIG